MAEQTRRYPATSGEYTWRTFAFFFALALVVRVVLQLVLERWLPGDVASGVGIGATVPIVLSGNRRWREPRVLPWVVVVLVAMGLLGGLVAWWRR
jgi:hypothetical protein